MNASRVPPAIGQRYAWLRVCLRSIVPLLGCLLLTGCPSMMESSPPYDLTFRGRVSRSDAGTAVAGAHVEVWVRPEEVGTSAPFVQGQTNQAGEFVLSRRLRNRGLPQDVTVRATPPAQSGLRPGSVVFPSITGSHGKYTYATEVVLQPATGS